MVGAKSYVIKSFSNGAYVDGLFVGETESERTVLGSLQPLGEDMKRLPEGLDSSSTLKFYTRSKLRTSDQGEQREDLLIFEGASYAIHKAQVHTSGAPLPHGKYWLERKGNQ